VATGIAIADGRSKSVIRDIPTEADEQTTLFRWAAISAGKYPQLQLMYHIPNGGSRNAREAHNLRLQGVKAGVPDICLPVACGGYSALYIEMKRKRGGRVSDDQKAWIDKLTKAGNRAVVCCGFEEAQAEIIKYLECRINETSGGNNGNHKDGVSRWRGIRG